MITLDEFHHRTRLGMANLQAARGSHLSDIGEAVIVVSEETKRSLREQARKAWGYGYMTTPWSQTTFGGIPIITDATLGDHEIRFRLEVSA